MMAALAGANLIYGLGTRLADHDESYGFSSPNSFDLYLQKVTKVITNFLIRHSHNVASKIWRRASHLQFLSFLLIISNIFFHVFQLLLLIFLHLLQKNKSTLGDKTLQLVGPLLFFDALKSWILWKRTSNMTRKNSWFFSYFGQGHVCTFELKKT